MVFAIGMDFISAQYVSENTGFIAWRVDGVENYM